jgi:hypothetical protein
MVLVGGGIVVMASMPSSFFCVLIFSLYMSEKYAFWRFKLEINLNRTFEKNLMVFYSFLIWIY